MTKTYFLRKPAAAVAARRILFSAALAACGLLLVSCAESKAIKSAPSIDAVAGLNNKLTWLKANAVTGGEYVIELTADDAVSSGLFSKGTLYYKDKSNITITIRGVGENRTIFQKSPGDQMFDVGSGVTLVLDNNITLRGSREADSTLGIHDKLVGVSSGGTLVMNDGAAIVGNVNNTGSGGAVAVSGGGAFIMNGGMISGNMSILGKGTIKRAIDAAILGKAGAAALLGAASDKLPQHTMLSKGLGKAAENTAKSELSPAYPVCRGGGVYVGGASSFFGKNTPAGTFVKTGGTITGYDSDPEKGNSAHDCDVKLQMDEAGQVKEVNVRYTLSADGGHAIYFGGSEPKSVNATVGPDVCFEFRDGVYRDIRCETQNPAEAAAEPVAAVEADSVPEVAVPEVSAAEEVVDPELLAVFGGAAPAAEGAALEQAMAPAAEEAVPAEEERIAAPAPPPPEPLYDGLNVAAYVYGAKDPGVNKAMAARLVAALANDRRYQASEDYMEFFDQAAEAQKKVPGPMDVNLIKDLGERFGVDYVCVAEISAASGAHQTSAHLVRVKTAKIVAGASYERPLETLKDLTEASKRIVEEMVKEEPPPPEEAVPIAIAPPAEPPPVQSYEPSESYPAYSASAVEETAAAEKPNRRYKIGLALGYGFSGDAYILQLGGIYIHPITEKVVSLVAEANFWLGEEQRSNKSYSETISFYGANIPALVRFEKSVFYSEAGLFLDILSGQNELKYKVAGMSGNNMPGTKVKEAWLFNYGIAASGGLAFRNGYTQCFYRFNYGLEYYSHVVGLRQLF